MQVAAFTLLRMSYDRSVGTFGDGNRASCSAFKLLELRDPPISIGRGRIATPKPRPKTSEEVVPNTTIYNASSTSLCRAFNGTKRTVVILVP